MTLVTGHTTLAIPVIESDRLRLRAPKASDVDAYVEFLGSDRATGIGGPFDADHARAGFLALTGHWAFHGYGRWIVADHATDAPLGVVGLLNPHGWPEPELAWSVFAAAEGRGVAHEAALLTRRYAYEELGWTTLISCIFPDNHRSIALARRLGAVEDGGFDLPDHGRLTIWRHPSAGEAAA